MCQNRIVNEMIQSKSIMKPMYTAAAYESNI